MLRESRRKNHGHLVQAHKFSGRRDWKFDYINKQRGFAEAVESYVIKESTVSREIEKDVYSLLDALFGDTTTGIQIVSATGIVQYANSALKSLLAYPSGSLVGQHVSVFLTKEQQKIFLQMMKDLQENHGEKTEKVMIINGQGGKSHHLSLSMKNQIHQPSIKGILVYWKDITEDVNHQEEIEFFLSHDTLTKLPNAISLKKEIRRFCRRLSASGRKEHFALIMLDVNRFKFINDVLGYQQGDQLMVCIAQRLREFLGNQFLCRYMGDQFAVLLRGYPQIEDYERVAKDLLSLFHQPFKIGIYEMDVAVAMGISVFPKDDQSPDGLINCANIALLRTKQEGKHEYAFYTPQIRVELYRQMSLRNTLLKSLENEEFQVYYQPMVHLGSNEIIAAEALLRWKHPDWGMIPPNDFIPLAEENGAIINLGKWLLRQVCRHYRQWLDQGYAPGKISVNYSTVQFFEKNFVENILETIQEYQLSPRFLIMEITESVLMKNAEKVTSDLYRLRKLGVQIALDDFGTGFSCLAYLKTFPIDVLKIDRFFIQHLFQDSSSSTIIRSVIQMAQDLNIKLVAEGIENEEQRSYLQELHCYAGQGFLYCKPMAENMFSRVLEIGTCIPAKFCAGKKENPFWDRRQFIRIKLPEMFPAEMGIYHKKTSAWSEYPIRVGIKNIGTIGLCFSSDVRISLTEEVSLNFTLPFFDQSIKVTGKPVWISGPDDGIYECGVQFSFQSNEEVNEVSTNLYTLCKQLYL